MKSHLRNANPIFGKTLLFSSLKTSKCWATWTPSLCYVCSPSSLGYSYPPSVAGHNMQAPIFLHAPLLQSASFGCSRNGKIYPYPWQSFKTLPKTINLDCLLCVRERSSGKWPQRPPWRAGAPSYLPVSQWLTRWLHVNRWVAKRWTEPPGSCLLSRDCHSHTPGQPQWGWLATAAKSTECRLLERGLTMQRPGLPDQDRAIPGVGNEVEWEDDHAVQCEREQGRTKTGTNSSSLHHLPGIQHPACSQVELPTWGLGTDASEEHMASVLRGETLRCQNAPPW